MNAYICNGLTIEKLFNTLGVNLISNNVMLNLFRYLKMIWGKIISDDKNIVILKTNK